MSKKIAIPCPQCRQVLNVPPEYAGQRVACKRCEAVFTIVLPSAAAEGSPSTVEGLEPLKAELAKAQSEVKALRDELAVQAEQIKADTVELEAALETNRTLQSQLAAVSSELAEARKLRQLDQEEASRLRSEQESRIAALESESAVKLADLGRLSESHEAVKAQLQTAEDRLAALQAELEQTRSEHAEKEANWVHFAGNLDELKSRLEESEERAKATQSALEQSRSDCQTLDAHVQHLKEAVHEAEQSRDKESEQAKTHANALDALQARLDELQSLHESSISAHQKEREEFLARVNELSTSSSSPSVSQVDEIGRLREELASAQSMVEELSQKLETARSSENLAKSHLYQLGIRLPN